ncbi:MAG: hypothetical protein V4556_13745 [Bacteroidota bacterium]
MRSCLTILLFTILSSANAQNENDSTNSSSYLSKVIMIDPQKFLGTWESVDSSKHQIEFYFYNKIFFLAPRSDTGIHRSFAFQFFRQDSSSMVSNSAMIIKWPPDGCYINPINKDNIEIKYGYFGSRAFSINYRRIQKKVAW